MVNVEKLDMLYDKVIDGDELTTKKLNELGFNSKDIKDLIEQGILERVKRGYYSFKAVNNLFYYGKKLVALKQFGLATECFYKCHELDENHEGVNFQLFLRCIQNKDYEKAFTYFDYFFKGPNPFYNADSNLYLFLLNSLAEVPERYKEYADSLNFEDFKVDEKDKRFKNIVLQNKIRTSVVNGRFILARKQLQQSIDEKGKNSVQDLLLKNLLDQIISKEVKIKKQIIKFINDGKYEDIVKIFDENYKVLNKVDRHIRMLASDLVDMRETQHIPAKEIFTASGIFEAIEGQNYDLALELAENFNQKTNHDKQENILYLLLVAVRDEMQKIRDKEKEEADYNEEVVQNEEAEQKEDDDFLNNNVETDEVKDTLNKDAENIKISFTDIVKSLMINDVEKTFKYLETYLENINKKQYEFLIMNLIKISLLENDMSFLQPLTTLINISRNDFEFNINEYVQAFYLALSKNNLEVAKIYLDILYNSDNFEEEKVLIENLNLVLDTFIKKENGTSTTAIDVFDEEGYNHNSSEIEDNDSEINEENLETGDEEQDNKVEKTNKLEVANNYNDEEFVNRYLSTVYDKGIVVLKPLKEERRKGIHEIVDNIPNVTSFDIGEKEKTRIVLRYMPDDQEYFDFTQVLREGDEAFRNKDYHTCIAEYRKILEIKEPRPFVYAKIGLAYLKINDKKTAIDYLRVATELSKLKDNTFDFEDLIAGLEGLIPEEDKKPKVKMKVDDFGNDLLNYYGIENITDICNLVLSGFSIEEACQQWHLDSEEVGKVYLIFAKEYFAQGKYLQGNQCLKHVEKMKNKSNELNKIFNEVVRNKKFYKNRVTDNYKSLVLKKKD